VEIDISTILVSYNTAHLLPEVMNSLQLASIGLAVESIIVDNASSDGSVNLIRRDFADSRLIANDVNVGFGRANNQALPFAMGRYVLLLNTDAFVAPDTLKKSLAYMDSHPECGILGVRLEGRDGKLQPCARYFPTPWNVFLERTGLDRFFKNVRLVDDMEWDHRSERRCDWVVGCYYLARKTVIDQIGLFDPRFFLYGEEVDHCFRAKKAGWEVVFFPDTTVVHLGGESAKFDGKITKGGRQLQALQIESELLYYRKNHGAIGVLSDLFLVTLADVIDMLKSQFRRSSELKISDTWSHVALFWLLFWRTRGGTKPTR
jgi:GT2 family glycosyltransferase